MLRATVLAALFAAVPAAQAADEPGFCKSMCGSERQECKATARRMTGNDTLLERSATDEKNPFANTAGHIQGQSEQARVAANDSFLRRHSERTGACEDTYLRCTRSCTVQDKAKRGS